MRIERQPGVGLPDRYLDSASLGTLSEIEYCEQPVVRWDLAGLKKVREVSPIPIAADEALFGSTTMPSLLPARGPVIISTSSLPNQAGSRMP